MIVPSAIVLSETFEEDRWEQFLDDMIEWYEEELENERRFDIENLIRDEEDYVREAESDEWNERENGSEIM